MLKPHSLASPNDPLESSSGRFLSGELTICLTICVHAVKPGHCPIPETIPLCAKSCFHDGQCPATQKCCPTTGGFACKSIVFVAPVFR
uniref:WAP domain-containing protein n=1 Tax=Sinocyclocheilus rhinocerous TaxID=307959 RepID=A0A673KP07_9TELE